MSQRRFLSEEKAVMPGIRDVFSRDSREIIELFENGSVEYLFDNCIIIPISVEKKHGSWMESLYDQIFSCYCFLSRNLISKTERDVLFEKMEEIGMLVNMEKEICNGCGMPVMDIKCDSCIDELSRFIRKRLSNDLPTHEISKFAEKARKMSASFELAYACYNLLDEALRCTLTSK